MADAQRIPRHFVLVHGGWQAAWTWFRVVPLLEVAGHSVTAVTLPGHGTDPTPAEALTSIAVIAAPVRRVVEESSDPVVLVGHSMGGAIISAVAEAVPHKVAMLVYVASFMLDDGQSIFDLALDPRFAPEAAKHMTTLPEGSETPLYSHVDPGFICSKVFERCPDDVKALATLLYRPQPLAALTLPVAVSRDRWGSVRRCYVHVEDDKAVPHALQKHLVELHGVEKAYTVDGADHLAQLSKPVGTADIFMEIAERLNHSVN